VKKTGSKKLGLVFLLNKNGPEIYKRYTGWKEGYGPDIINRLTE